MRIVDRNGIILDVLHPEKLAVCGEDPDPYFQRWRNTAETETGSAEGVFGSDDLTEKDRASLAWALRDMPAEVSRVVSGLKPSAAFIVARTYYACRVATVAKARKLAAQKGLPPPSSWEVAERLCAQDHREETRRRAREAAARAAARKAEAEAEAMRNRRKGYG